MARGAGMPDMDDLLDALEDGPVPTSVDRSAKSNQSNAGLAMVHVQKSTQPQGMEAVLDALDQEDASSRTPTVPSIALDPPVDSEVSPESLNTALESASERESASELPESVPPPSNDTPNNMEGSTPPAVPVSSPNLTPPPTPFSTPANVDPSNLPIPSPPAPTPVGSVPESRASPTTMTTTILPDDDSILELKPAPLQDGGGDDSGHFGGSASSAEVAVKNEEEESYVFPSGLVAGKEEDDSLDSERNEIAAKKAIADTVDELVAAVLGQISVKDVKVDQTNDGHCETEVVESDVESEKTDETTLSDIPTTPEPSDALELEPEASDAPSLPKSEESEVIETVDQPIDKTATTSEPEIVESGDQSTTEASTITESEPIESESIPTTEASTAEESEPIESQIQPSTEASTAEKPNPIESETPSTTVAPITDEPSESPKTTENTISNPPEPTSSDAIEATTFTNVTVDELSPEANSQLLKELEELEVDEAPTQEGTTSTDQPDAPTASIEPEADSDAQVTEEPSNPEDTVKTRDTPGPSSSSTRPTSVILSTHDLSVMSPEFRLTESELQLGKSKPYWIPDEDCPNCMLCTTRFTVINRRHHCRCCGRVLCSSCCNLKRSLPYNDESDKKEKVCEPCSKTLDRIVEYEQLVELGIVNGPGDERSDAVPTTDPTVDDEPGPSSSSTTPRTPGFRKKSVLKTKKPEGTDPEAPPERKRTVQFLDGVRPGFASDEAGSSRPSSSSVGSGEGSSEAGSSSKLKKVRRPSSRKNSQKRIDEEGLTLFSTTHVTLIENELHSNRTDIFGVLRRILDGERITIAVKRNVWANIQLSYHGLSKSKVWSCSTTGLQSIGIDEIFLAFEATDADYTAVESAISALELLPKSPPSEVIEIDPDAEDVPKPEEEVEPQISPDELRKIVRGAVPIQLLRLVLQIFCTALNAADDSLDERIGIRQCGARMGRIYTIENGVIGSHEVSSVLFSRPLGQDFGELTAPENAPFLIGTLVKAKEVPWVQAIPNRLLLRMGNSTSCFPYPIVNPVNREPLYTDMTENSILKMFNNFKNWTYKMPRLLGSTIIIEGGAIARVNIPPLAGEELRQLLETNKTMIAFSTDLSDHVDSHLVAVQLPDGAFRTEIFTDVNASRDRISASFVVLDGSLRNPNENFSMNIVEDGIVLRFPVERMEDVVRHLQTKTPLSIESGSMKVVFEFESPPLPLNPMGAVVSPIDEKYLLGNYQYGLTLHRQLKTQIPLNGLPEWALRLTAVVNLESGKLPVAMQSRYFEMCEQIGNVIGATIEPAIPMLVAMRTRTIAIRITMDTENVSYETPEWLGLEEDRSAWITSLDDLLIPYLYTLSSLTQTPFNMELYFYILSIRLLENVTY
uniref:FYVE-type domain-containing protein n=1 Tax=Panagrellus redivivus TaxID=6233 RepID=A0A7E4VCH7_PANRE